MSDTVPRFRVGTPTRELDKLARWVRLAMADGRHQGLLDRIREVNYRLEFEADTWGSVIGSTVGLRTRRKHGTAAMLRRNRYTAARWRF